MIRGFYIIAAMTAGLLAGAFGQSSSISQPVADPSHTFRVQEAAEDTLASLIQLLSFLDSSSENPLYQRHCRSIINLVESRGTLTPDETRYLNDMYITFTNPFELWSSADVTTYLERKRPFIIAWKSPTDSANSLGWLFPPVNWDIRQTYPLYVVLHGNSGRYEDPIDYMTLNFKPDSVSDYSFADGYSFYPWGRGNIWYEGIGETDVWEGIDSLQSVVSIDPSRKYIAGFSMGGYGTLSLAEKSPTTWAAAGIYGGALVYQPASYSYEALEKILDLPVDFVCGTTDSFRPNNLEVFQLLQEAGNDHCVFTSFKGGHVALLENWNAMNVWMRNFTNANPTSISPITDVPDSRPELFSSYPNPFSAKGGSASGGNPATKIVYRTQAAGRVQLKIYDILGRELATLVDQDQPAGEYRIRFDAGTLASGTYIVRLFAGAYTATRKILLMK